MKLDHFSDIISSASLITSKLVEVFIKITLLNNINIWMQDECSVSTFFLLRRLLPWYHPTGEWNLQRSKFVRNPSVSSQVYLNLPYGWKTNKPISSFILFRPVHFHLISSTAFGYFCRIFGCWSISSTKNPSWIHLKCFQKDPLGTLPGINFEH